MSVLTSFYTFEQMENAVVFSVSSENIGHQAQHAISPLEPNFAWEADEGGAQHEIIIDLGELKTCDTFFVIHHERITETPVVLGINLILSVSETLDSVDFQTIVFTETDGSSYNRSDDTNQLRVYVFDEKIFRYAKILVKGRTSPNFFANDDARFSALWFGTRHDLDMGTQLPINDIETFPNETIEMSQGKLYTTGLNTNSFTKMTRTYQVTNAQYGIIRDVMKACNGTHKPFVLIEDSDITRIYCHFDSDNIDEEILDTEVYRITLKLVATPVVQKNAIH